MVFDSGNVPYSCVDVKADPEGQHLFLRGMVGSVEVTLASLYAPNTRQDSYHQNSRLPDRVCKGTTDTGGLF